jgi:hypothetical protein
VIVLVSFTFGLIVWIVAWALFGVKAFDAFLFTALLTFAAGGARLALPHVQRMLHGSPASPGER